MSKKMTREDWDNLKYFSIAENWGNPLDMDKDFMLFLDDLRGYMELQFVVNYGTQGKHSTDSFHYKGRAVDGHFLDITPMACLDRLMERLDEHGHRDKVGIGFYPDWYNPGFHIDNRAMDGTKPATFWVRIEKPDYGISGGYHYREEAWEIIKQLKEGGMV
ncbi:MAG: hypothetical protein JW984_11095 [Deltaproteobacteria bacterium]|uniref:Peptidase M15A C-terminal domain-containing protein n=1 Tax=Candidatus Zymogenus saltonus TaxID=2844893 RepID=A0A9D8KEN4_9DELT|nr:hypothetical protein [Candidatus Zymogenus saltonus]